jgi:hypothetical protein
MGTAVGTQVFIRYGWRPAAALSVAWSGFTLAVMLIRGPHCARHTWFGYEGGFELRKRRAEDRERHVEAGGDGGVHIQVDAPEEETRALGLLPPPGGGLPDERGYREDLERDGGQGTTAQPERGEGKTEDNHDHREGKTLLMSIAANEATVPRLSGSVPVGVELQSVEGGDA